MTNSSGRVVQHHCLTRRDAADGFVEGEPELPVHQVGRTGDRAAVCPQLGHRPQREFRFPAAGEHHPFRRDDADVQTGCRTDGDGAGYRLDPQDVPGPAVRRRPLQVQPLALTDRVCEEPVVLRQHVTGLGIDHRTRSGTQLVDQVAVGVAVGDEADVVRVGLGRDREAASRGLLPDLLLGQFTEREHAVLQLLRGQHRQYVGLVLGHVHGAVQDPVPQPDVVPGGHRVEAERDRPIQQRGELDLLVAPQARVRGAAGRVLGEEVGNHVLEEVLAEIPDVVRNPEQIADSTGVEGVLDRAAAAGPGAQGSRVAGQRHVHAGHVMTGIHRQCRRHGRVDAAAHRGQHAHQRPAEA